MKKLPLLGAARTIVEVITAAVVMAAFTAGASNAAVIINVTEVGGGVNFSTTGSLDLTGATSYSVVHYSDGLIPGGSSWYIASGSGDIADWYAMTSSDGAFGTSTTFISPPDFTFGDDFFIWGDGLGAPNSFGVKTGYISGDAIASEMVFSGATIAGLSMISGTYNYAIPNDTITLNIASSIVPIPAAGWLFSSGLVGLACLTRRKA